jgi:hypothetical protein
LPEGTAVSAGRDGAAAAPRADAPPADRRAPAVTSLDPVLVDRLTDDVIRRVERRIRIERERRGV